MLTKEAFEPGFGVHNLCRELGCIAIVFHLTGNKPNRFCSFKQFTFQKGTYPKCSLEGLVN